MYDPNFRKFICKHFGIKCPNILMVIADLCCIDIVLIDFGNIFFFRISIN